MKRIAQNLLSIRRLGVLAIALISQNGIAGTLCNRQEIVIFSCKVASTKTLSVCGSSSDEHPYLQYRFGRTGQIELVFPAQNEDSLSKFDYSYNHEKTSGLTTYALSFSNEGFTYMISTDDMDMSRLEPGTTFKKSATITISSGSGKDKILTCVNNQFTDNLNLLDDMGVSRISWP